MSQFSILTPHLTVRDVERAARFYERALGFQVRLLLPGGDGQQIRHAEVELAGARVMIGPESPQRGMLAPVSRDAPPAISLYLGVANVDEAHARALHAGANELLAPNDQFFGARTSVVADPDGHQWMLAERQKDMSEGEMRRALQAQTDGQRLAHTDAERDRAVPRRRNFKTD